MDDKKKKKSCISVQNLPTEVNNRLAELEIICCEEDPTYEYDIKITKILEDLGFPSFYATRFNEYINRWR